MGWRRRLVTVPHPLAPSRRLIGAVSPTPVLAQAYGALCILTLVLTSGYTITRTAIPPWFIW